MAGLSASPHAAGKRAARPRTTHRPPDRPVAGSPSFPFGRFRAKLAAPVSSSINWLRLLAALATGVAWAASFPLPGIAGLAWLAPGLLLAITAGPGTGAAFRTAYIAGAAHYLVSLSWLRHIPFPAGAYAGWLALSFFLALLPALWAVGCWRIARAVDLAPARASGRRELARHAASRPWWRLQIGLVMFAAAWVAWEMIIARLFGGFPWNLLGASQYRMLPLIQITSVTGVYGVSFLIVWFSTGLAAAGLLMAHDPRRSSLWRGAIVPPAILTAAVAASGALTLSTAPPAQRSLRVALIQPAIPQMVIFDPDSGGRRFETLFDLTEEALASDPDLVLWPEASLPGGLHPSDLARLTNAVRNAGAWMVFGADEVVARTPSDPDSDLVAYNAAFLLNPGGEIVASYRKRRLVIFGEYIPFADWLPFLHHLAPIGEGFHAGREATPFHMESLGVTTSVLICFEDNFPQQAREHAPPGTDFLLNLTNDAWFGRSAAQWQHTANSVFRAIENGIPLVRCANNGVSAWIDPRGRIHSQRIAEGRDVYDAGVEIATVRFAGTPRTLYNRVGDVFGWTCVCATVVALALPRRPPGLTIRTPR